MLRFIGVLSLSLVLSVPAPSSAQRPPAIKSFRHANTLKEIQSLEWIGLYEQLQP
jgi:hypothetical protein